MSHSILITHAIMSDPTLTQPQKIKLISDITPKGKSIIPPALATLAVKFNALNPATQIILSILGFGIGRYLLDQPNSHDKMINLDKPTNGYILKQ